MESLGSCGEMIRRPLGSTARQTQDPSPGSAERMSSTLKPGKVANASAGVACLDPRPETRATAPAMTLPQGSTPSFPRLTGRVQPSATNPGFSHQAVSLLAQLHDVSVTTDFCLAPVRVDRVRSSLPMNPADLESFLPRAAMVFSPGSSARVTSTVYACCQVSFLRTSLPLRNTMT